MAIRVVGKRMSGGSTHEHITHLFWIGPGSNEVKSSTREAMVNFIDVQSGQAYVTDGVHTVYLYVRQIGQRPKFVQTWADGVWSDNLLALPDM